MEDGQQATRAKQQLYAQNLFIYPNKELPIAANTTPTKHLS